MARLLLIRHGETTWNAERRTQGQLDAPLSPLGREQAGRLAERLRAEPMAAIYASDLGRAMDTAGPIAAAHGLPVEPAPALREAKFGDWEGLVLTEVRDRWGEDLRRWWREPHRYHAPNGESLDEVAGRVTALLLDLLARHDGQTVAVVGHGGSLRAGLLTLLDLPLAAFRRFWLDNASLTILQHRRGLTRLVSFNETWHLNGARNAEAVLVEAPKPEIS